MSRYKAKLAHMDRLPTPALLRAIVTIQEDMAEADTPQQAERHYSLQCLLEYAQDVLETRRDSYTGEFDS